MGKRKNNDARKALDGYAASLGLREPVVPRWVKVVGGALVTLGILIKLALVSLVLWGGYELVVWLTSK